jgi:hypothetical protein
LRFEIGLKLAGVSSSRPGFLSNGVTEAALNMDGKTPSEKDRLASVQMSSEKTTGHDLMSEVGI